MSKEFLKSQNRTQGIEAHSEDPGISLWKGISEILVAVEPGEPSLDVEELMGYRWEEDWRKGVR